MAAHTATMQLCPGNTTDYLGIDWSSFDSGANNMVIQTKGKDGSKLIVLLAAHTTLNNRIWIGTSDSRSSGAKASTVPTTYPFSASRLGRMKIQTTLEVDGADRSKFQSTVAADTEIFAIYAFGPFETARFVDGDGYINICRGITDVGEASHSSDAQYIAVLQIP